MICQLLESARLPASAQGNLDTWAKLCTSTPDPSSQCLVLRAFALANGMGVADVFGRDNPCGELFTTLFCLKFGYEHEKELLSLTQQINASIILKAFSLANSMGIACVFGRHFPCGKLHSHQLC